MPNFDFMVGVSIAFALKRAAQSSDKKSKWEATYKATIRTIRLFVLGILTQCGVGFMQYQLRYNCSHIYCATISHVPRNSASFGSWAFFSGWHVAIM
jgi:hypothetical protein